MGERVESSAGIEDDGVGTLTIHNARVGHEGEYTCQASNVGGNATYVTTLDVQGKQTSLSKCGPFCSFLALLLFNAKKEVSGQDFFSLVGTVWLKKIARISDHVS